MDLQLGRDDTALVNAGRSAVSGSNGDMWNALWATATTSYYNSTRSAYLTLEDQIHATYQSGYSVTGTNQDGSHPTLNDEPNHPRPPIK